MSKRRMMVVENSESMLSLIHRCHRRAGWPSLRQVAAWRLVTGGHGQRGEEGTDHYGSVGREIKLDPAQYARVLVQFAMDQQGLTETWTRSELATTTQNRPNSAHGELTPAEFALQWTTTHQPQVA